MKIVVAPQAFKGSLGAFQVCYAMRDGIKQVFPNAEVDISPMADGGDGTLEVLVQGTGGKVVTARVTGPLGEEVEAVWGVLGDGKTAVIEMARASGLALVPDKKRDPRITTTYGTGELIKLALDAGYRRVIIGVGGSATCDGGAGMAQALGVSLRDSQGRELPLGGAALAQLHSIDISKMDPRVSQTKFQVASDVTNPLCGPEGTAAIYAPQKGATPDMVRELDSALAQYDQILQLDLGIEIRNVPGAGAAGGLGAGLMTFLKAKLRPGVEVVADAIGFSDKLVGANLVLTGEGQLDGQSIYGKTIFGVGTRAKTRSVPVIAIVGGIGPGYQHIYNHGVAAAMSITPRAMTLEAAMSNAYTLIAEATERALRMIALGIGLANNHR